MQTELTHILEKWQKPELEEIGDAKQLIKELNSLVLVMGLH